MFNCYAITTIQRVGKSRTCDLEARASLTTALYCQCVARDNKFLLVHHKIVFAASINSEMFLQHPEGLSTKLYQIKWSKMKCFKNNIEIKFLETFQIVR